MFGRLGSEVRTVLAALFIIVMTAAALHASPTASFRTNPQSPPSTPQPLSTYTALPSGDSTDGKFMTVAGNGLSTLAGISIVIYVGVPSGRSNFEVGIFDGDTSTSTGGHWDSRVDYPILNYKLYRDPLKNGTTTSLLWQGTSEQMVDNGWYTISFSTDGGAKAPSGNYFYRLDANWADSRSTSFNNFKVRTDGQISLRAGQEFGFDGGPQNPIPQGGNDPCAGTSGNSYDGSWNWYFHVPTVRTSITFRDGDFDHGPNGRPADDGTDSCLVIPPDIYYTVKDPENHLYTNNNPSENQVWNDFTIGPNSGDDVVVNYTLQPGLWNLHVIGADAHNACFLRASHEIYSNADLPLTVSPSPSVFPDHTQRTPADRTLFYSHIVKNEGTVDEFNLASASQHAWATAIYADTNGNGVLDPGEPKITQTGPMAPGQELPILLELVVPPGVSGITDLATVTASSRTEWALQGSAKDTTLLSNPPHAILAPVDPIPEGTNVTLNASASWDPDEDALQFRWDFNGDGTWDTSWSPNSTTTYTWGDDYSGTVRVEVQDTGLLNDTAETAIHVTNVSPVVTNLTITSTTSGCNDTDDEHGNHDGEHEHDDHGCGDRDDDCHDDDRGEGCKDHDDERGCKDGDDDHERDGRGDEEHDHDEGGCGCHGDGHDDEEGDHDGDPTTTTSDYSPKTRFSAAHVVDNVQPVQRR